MKDITLAVIVEIRGHRIGVGRGSTGRILNECLITIVTRAEKAATVILKMILATGPEAR